MMMPQLRERSGSPAERRQQLVGKVDVVAKKAFGVKVN